MELLPTPEVPTPQETAHKTAKQLLASVAIWEEYPELAREAQDLHEAYVEYGPDAVSETDALNLLTGAIDVIAA